jgi:large subunit ribosomal protein L4
MAKVAVVDKSGKKVSDLTVGEKLSQVRISLASIHRTVVAEEANKRQGTQSAKTRSEVRGGGRKPYKQKKTGNARQGSIRSPHYAHGGMALAVKPRSYDKKVNRKERRAALLSALSAHIEAGNVHVVDSLAFAEPRTKDALAVLDALGLQDCPRVLVVLTDYDVTALKCFRNLPNVTVRTAPASGTSEAKTQTFSTRDLMIARKLVVAQAAMEKIQEVWLS